MTNARRAILVGLSGADWHLLRPLIDSGRMPHLGALIEQGAQGNLRTLQPQFPPLLWTSLATGRRADAHGVLSVFDTRADHAAPLSSLSWRCHALWQQFAAHNRRSLVVNWPNTYPAFRHRGVCVSDLFFRLAGSPDGLESPAPGSVHPDLLLDQLAELRLLPSCLGREELSFFVDEIDGAAEKHPAMISRLAVALAENISTHAVVTELIEQQDWDLAMVRYDLLETLGYRFMSCHPPQLGWVPNEVYGHFHKAMVSACRYLDEQLGQLLKLLDDDTFICLFSERGLQSGGLRPHTPDLATQHGGVPWYREYGVLVLSGPGIERDATVVGASLIDIAPTVLAATNLPLADGLEGRVLAEAFVSPPEGRRSGMPLPSMERCGGFKRGRELTADERKLINTRLVELELISPDEEANSQGLAERRVRNNQFILAMVHMEAGRNHLALPLLENLHEHNSDDDRMALHLARCRQALGDLTGARDVLLQVVDHPDIRPNELMELARLHLALAEPDKALACLFRAEQAEGERPEVHCRIGEVYLDIERLDEAERAFSKALERDRQHARSHLGLARVRLGQGRVEEAVESALSATELDGRLILAHYWLGQALRQAGQAETAMEAFKVVLSMQPGHLPSRRALAALQRASGDEQAAAESEREIRRLERLARVSDSLNEALDRVRR